MPQNAVAVGIDFGTSTSLVAVYEPELLRSYIQTDPESPDQRRAPWTPTLVGVSNDDERGESRLVVGWGAHDFSDSQNVFPRVKSHLGDPGKRFRLFGTDYRPEELAAVVLRHVALNASRNLGRPVRDVVLSIPANFGGAAREALLSAAKMAGLNPLRLVNEPTAAAVSYALDRPQTDEHLLVFDFGGGTLDITILRKEKLSLRVHSTHGDRDLGGADFDRVLGALIAEGASRAHGDFEKSADFDAEVMKRAEWVKVTLSQSERANVFIPFIGLKGGKPLALNLTVTRQAFLDAARPLLERAHRCLGEAVMQSGLTPDQIDRVLLVGGTVQIPAVAELVTGIFGERCRKHDPLTAVAEGAGVLAASGLGLLKGAESGLELSDVAGHGLGMRYRQGANGPYMYGCLIKPNQSVPHKVVKEGFTLQTADQRSVLVSLYEGHAAADSPLDESKFRQLCSATAYDIPISETGVPHRVRVEFSYDENAVVELRATVVLQSQNGLTHAPKERVIPLRYDMRLSEQDLRDGSARVRHLWGRTGAGWDAQPPDVIPPAAGGDDGDAGEEARRDETLVVGDNGHGGELTADALDPEAAHRLLSGSIREVTGLLTLPSVQNVPRLRDNIRDALRESEPILKRGTAEQKRARVEELEGLLKRFKTYNT